MPSLSPITTSSSLGRTFIVAAGLLGFGALALVGGVAASHLKKKTTAAVTVIVEPERRPPERIDVRKLIADSPPPVDTLPTQSTRAFPVNPAPLPPVAVPENPASPAPIASLPPSQPARPTPVPLSAFTPKTDPRVPELVEQGKLLRGNGDTAGALAKLREAMVLDPANPLPIAESAYTYEKMGLNDRAAEQWRRVLALGEGGGVYFSAAKSKLDAAVMATTKEVGGTPSSTQIAEGKSLAIGSPTIQDDADPGSAKRFLLRVPVRARAGEKIIAREMKVFVLFYDKVGSKEIGRTLANVNNRWATPPTDWADGESETLEVTYDLPMSAVRSEPREYYGYIVRVYYKGELQDTQAEPAALNQKFPAPFQLSE